MREWWSETDDSTLFLSVLVLGEIQRGVERLFRVDPVRASHFARWMKSINQGFRGRILPVNLETALIWGEMTSTRSIPVVDGLLAATAVTHNLTLVTRNTKDIKEIGVSYLNPFESGPF